MTIRFRTYYIQKISNTNSPMIESWGVRNKRTLMFNMSRFIIYNCSSNQYTEIVLNKLKLL